MNILGIETSCDETAAAVVADGRVILSNVIASQVAIHAQYGGIVPEVASREHVIWIIPVVEQALAESQVGWEDLDLIAVTNGPGLAGSLLVGANAAKSLAMGRGLPLIGVNHLEGHVYANWLVDQPVLVGQVDRAVAEPLPPPPRFPNLCLIVSGAHSDIVLMEGHGLFRSLGRSRDDASGEAFDKVARILGLGYPGGPAIQRVAEKGNPRAYPVPRAWLKGTYDFSFSGVKTAMLRLAHGLGLVSESGIPSTARVEAMTEDQAAARQQIVADLAASFQESVVDILVSKTIDAAAQHGVQEILLAGGVAANKRLREVIVERSPLPVRFAKPILCTDNAAMVAAAGYFHFQKGEVSDLSLDVYPNLRLIA